MSVELILSKHLMDHGVAPKPAAWSRHLNVNKSTLSRILSGKMRLTRKRAAEWATRIYPDNAEARGDLIAEFLASATSKTPTVAQLCDNFVANGGAVSAERISEVFAALCRPDVQDPLVCVEYRDSPRATPDAKYPELGAELAKAIAHGMNFAMFLPFGSEIPSPTDHGVIPEFASPAPETARFMQKITDECRGAYLSFRSQVINLLMEEDGQGQASAAKVVKSRLRAYEAESCGRCTSGFVGKIFYVEWRDKEKTRHQRIFEWSSTPKKDWLLYRGEIQINPTALRDSFYPIPHFFEILSEDGVDEQRRLPSILDPNEDEAKEKYQMLYDRRPGFMHPRPGAWRLSQVCKATDIAALGGE